MLATPISLSSSVLAAVCSRVLTLILYLGCASVAPTIIHLVRQGHGDRLAGDGLVEIPVCGEDAGNRALPTRGQHGDPVAGPDRAGDDLTGKAPEVEVGPVDPLHRKAERTVLDVVLDLDGLEVPDEGRSLVPGSVGTEFGDVVA